MPDRKGHASRRRSTLRGVVLAAVVLSVVSCTFLGSRDVVQCNGDSDCVPARPVCVAHLCAAAAADVGPPDAAVDIPCNASVDCLQTDHPQVCVSKPSDAGRKVCVRADSAVCPIILPTTLTYQEDPVTLIGIYTTSPVTSPASYVVRYALEKINQQLPPGSHIAAVMCEKGAPSTKGTARDTISHLASLGVPLVIGDFETGELLDVSAQAEFANMAVWSTLGSDKSIQPPAFPALGFLLDDYTRLADAYQAVLDKAVARAEELRGAPLTDKRVQVVATMKTKEVKGLVGMLTGRLMIRGEPVELTINTVESPFDPLRTDANVEVVQALRDSPPSLIMGIGGVEIVADIVAGVEKSNSASRPVWILSPRSKYDTVDLTTILQRKNPIGTPDLRARIFGVDFSGSTTTQEQFFSEVSTGVSNNTIGSFDHFYDAIYATAYASLLAEHSRDGGTGRLTNGDFMRGLQLLGANAPAAVPDPTTQAVGVGAEEFARARGYIREGVRIGFSGSTGPWVVDPKTYARRMGTSLYCYKPATEKVPNPFELTYYLDPTQSLDGKCYSLGK